MVFYLIILIYFLTLVLIAKEILTWVYLVQLKEYRYDRLKDYFFSPEGKKVLKNRLIVLAILFFYLFLETFSHFLFQKRNQYSTWQLLPFSFFALYIIYSLIHFGVSLKAKNFRKPVFSLKALTIISLSILIILAIILLKLDFFIKYLEVTLFVILTFVPSIVLLATVFSYPLSYFLKTKIFNQARNKRKNLSNLLVIGITGSFGKTSVKEYLFGLLNQNFRVLRTAKHVNTEIGVAETVLKRLTSEHQVFIAEMGAYREGEIKKICEVVQPEIGIVSGINEQHLALFGSMENIVGAKGELAEALPEKGLLIINGDDSFCQKIAKRTQAKVASYSLRKNSSADLKVSKAKYSAEKTTFEVIYREHSYLFSSNLIGEHNVQNLLAAILAAFEIGLKYEVIKTRVQRLVSPPENLEIKNKGRLVFVDNTYNLNPSSIKAALRLGSLYPDYKKVIVLDDVLELGEKSFLIHKKIGGLLSGIDRLFLIGQNYSAFVLRAALKNGLKRAKIVTSRDYLAIAQEIANYKPKTLIFFLGKGAKKVLKKLRV